MRTFEIDNREKENRGGREFSLELKRREMRGRRKERKVDEWEGKVTKENGKRRGGREIAREKDEEEVR